VEEGEVCDDGNDINTNGNCLSDCSKINYFDTERMLCGGSSSYLPCTDSSTLNKLCQDKGFTQSARLGNVNYQDSYRCCTYETGVWSEHISSMVSSTLDSFWCQ
jgi:hypothetical protein